MAEEWAGDIQRQECSTRMLSTKTLIMHAFSVLPLSRFTYLYYSILSFLYFFVNLFLSSFLSLPFLSSFCC